MRAVGARTADDARIAQVTRHPARPGRRRAGRRHGHAFWPLRLARGIVIGARRIALDVVLAEGRLVLDGDPGPPPYLMGIT